MHNFMTRKTKYHKNSNNTRSRKKKWEERRNGKEILLQIIVVFLSILPPAVCKIDWENVEKEE